jgi:histidinol-phosphate aminotransferase
MLDATNDRTKLLFICSPGNPTAKAIPLADIKAIASSNKYSGIVVVDEAYVDFSDQGTAVELVNKYPNIVVLQTLSKAFGLAGIRCGFCIGSPDVIQLMNNVKAPYNVNNLTSEVAINAMNSISTLEKNIAATLEQRKLVADKLTSLDFITKVFPSDSNFLLFQVKEKAQAMYKTMADNGVVSRYRGNEMHCDECIRVTIGTPEENTKFLELLQKTWADLSAA